MTDGNESTETKAKGIRVFVYGTLKEGHPNNYLLDSKETTFLGRCFLEGPFAMVNCSAFPGVVQDPDLPVDSTNRIYGEVYRIDSEVLATLDILEGNGDFYTRQKIDTPWKKAWCYFLPREYLVRYEKIKSGVWEPTDEEQLFVDGKVT